MSLQFNIHVPINIWSLIFSVLSCVTCASIFVLMWRAYNQQIRSAVQDAEYLHNTTKFFHKRIVMTLLLVEAIFAALCIYPKFCRLLVNMDVLSMKDNNNALWFVLFTIDNIFADSLFIVCGLWTLYISVTIYVYVQEMRPKFGKIDPEFIRKLRIVFYGVAWAIFILDVLVFLPLEFTIGNGNQQEFDVIVRAQIYSVFQSLWHSLLSLVLQMATIAVQVIIIRSIRRMFRAALPNDSKMISSPMSASNSLISNTTAKHTENQISIRFLLYCMPYVLCCLPISVARIYDAVRWIIVFQQTGNPIVQFDDFASWAFTIANLIFPLQGFMFAWVYGLNSQWLMERFYRLCCACCMNKRQRDFSLDNTEFGGRAKLIV